MFYMTLSDLKEYRRITADIRMQERALRIITGNEPRTAALREDIKADMARKKEMQKKERERLELYLSEVDDPVMQSLLRDYFLKGWQYHKVARMHPEVEVKGGHGINYKILYYVYRRSGLSWHHRSSQKGAAK